MRRTTVLVLSATLALAACSSDDPAATETSMEEPADSGTSTEEAAGGGSLTFTGTDDVAWSETMKSTAAGSTEITIECGASVGHTIAIEGVDDGADITACGAGATGSATVELEAGEYTYFCTVPGHRDAGMEGTLTVG